MTEKQMFKFKCVKHGEYESEHEKIGSLYWKYCPSCVLEGIESQKQEQAKYSEEIRLSGIDERTKRSGIPERFLDRTLENYVAKTQGQIAAHEFATKYATGFDGIKKTGRGAIFCGMPGTGKTHLAIAIGKYVIERGCHVGFITVQRMMRKLKDCMRKDAEESESEVMRILEDFDLLILDEVGVQFGSEYEKNSMFDILNARYEKRKPTILISNLSPSEVKAFIGDRVFDRMREDGGVCVIFNWESHRGSNAQDT